MREIPKYLEPVAAMALLNLAYAGMFELEYNLVVMSNQAQIDADFDRFMEEGVYGE